MSRLPHFYIVGAPKCGTTALYTYLTDHRQVARPRTKEPSYWSDDIRKKERTETLAAYCAQWRDAPDDSLRVDASSNYARSAVAIPRILEATPEAHMILMLRHPVDMAAAWHAQLLHSFDENVGSFEKAWRLQEVRRNGSRIPPECIDPECLQYRRVCALGEQLGRFVQLVPEKQRLIIIYDDFAGDTGRCYRQVLDFLGLPQDDRREFPRVNQNRSRRSALLTNAHRGAARRLGPLYRSLRALAGGFGLHPSAVIDAWNIQARPRHPLRLAFRAELLSDFAPEVERIEAILKRDLSAWRR